MMLDAARRVLRSPMAPLLIGLLGVVLRVRLYLASPSLPIDEASLARDIVDRSLTGLMGPLGYPQVVPPGFLIVEKLIESVAGPSEYALRVLPMICGVAVLALGWGVARRLLDRPAALCALLMCAISVTLIDFSVQVKQYPCDIAAALLIVFLALRLRESDASRSQALVFGLVGMGAVAFSFTAVFVLAAAVAALVTEALLGRARDGDRIVGVLWTAGIVLGPLLGRLAMNPSDNAYMQSFWHSAFMPLPRTGHDAFWLWFRMKDTFGYMAGFRITAFWLAMLALGAWSFGQRRRFAQGLLVLGPLVVVLSASALRLYPFWPGRLVVFLLPLLLIAVSAGGDFLLTAPGSVARAAGGLTLVTMAALAVASAATVTSDTKMEDTKPILQYIKDHRRPDDAMYVYYGAGQAFLYYAPRYGFTRDEVVIGSCARGRARTYLRELDRLRGRRVWVFVTHALDDERDLIVRYLEATGTRVDSTRTLFPNVGDGSKAHAYGFLYDLSARPEQAQVSPATFPVPIAMDGGPKNPWACYSDVDPHAQIHAQP